MVPNLKEFLLHELQILSNLKAYLNQNWPKKVIIAFNFLETRSKNLKFGCVDKNSQVWAKIVKVGNLPQKDSTKICLTSSGLA